MNTKEKIKVEIDQLPEDVLDDVLRYLYSMKISETNRYSSLLKGKFADRVLRESDSKEAPIELTSLQEFLLTAPVMCDEDYEFFLEKKKNFNKWK
ncbi:MAG: hypothetical protein GXO89_05855 [Chlorobi bacterium]|nr:hypothetical protein [Chlorobiota bacterium]